MLSEDKLSALRGESFAVLILVVMEYALGVVPLIVTIVSVVVLILVVMEYALGAGLTMK